MASFSTSTTISTTQFTDGTPNFPPSSISVNGGVAEEFISDRFNATKWLTIIAGLRGTEFRSSIAENQADPRVGVAVKVPRLNWVLRAFYGHYYQPPPLVTATGPLLDSPTVRILRSLRCKANGISNGRPVLSFPIAAGILRSTTIKRMRGIGWTITILENSNLFWPITWYAALIQGWDLSLRSPMLWHRAQFHLVYANQIAQATSPINGGLICPNPVTADCPLDIPPGYSPVDHDQRNTLNCGHQHQSSLAQPMLRAMCTTARDSSMVCTERRDSQYPGPYLPSHTTVDLSLGKSFSEGKYAVSVTALNVANLRVQLDNSLTFGGFHWNEPRQIYGEFRWRFHY